jgi:2-dehydro-3-deoxy-D-arabinonate dehydratase
MRLARVRDGGGDVHVGLIAEDELGVLATDDILGTLTAPAVPEPIERVPLLDREAVTLPAPWTLLPPVDAPETWAAGVTYEKSREARMRESKALDVYELVYDAERPELFLKDAMGRRTVGPGEAIGVRSDAEWTVPEPELAVVIGPDGEPLAATIGNDVSSRDIEGANPLYLPQAKIYARACALGPALLVPFDWSAPFEIELRILGPDGDTVFDGQTSTTSMCRSLTTLIEFLRRDNPVPAGSVLLTGTGIVPSDDVTLLPGQTVEIRIPGIGVLRNPVAHSSD